MDPDDKLFVSTQTNKLMESSEREATPELTMINQSPKIAVTSSKITPSVMPDVNADHRMSNLDVSSNTGVVQHLKNIQKSRSRIDGINGRWKKSRITPANMVLSGKEMSAAAFIIPNQSQRSSLVLDTFRPQPATQDPNEKRAQTSFGHKRY